MDWLVKLLYLGLFAYGVSGQTWEAPWVSNPGNGQSEVEVGSNIDILIDEGVTDLTIGILEYIGLETDIKIASSNGHDALLGLVGKCDGGGAKCVLITKNPIDFEASSTLTTYRVDVTIKTIKQDILIKIKNLDDNPTFMQLDGIDGCKVDERFDDKDVEEVTTDCKYTINDADGMLAGTTFKVIVEDPLHDYGKIFEFRLDNPNIPVLDKTAKVSLYVKENAIVKYSERSLYIFTVQLSEGTGSESDFRALIEIRDIPNMPPIWSDIMSMYQFLEHDTQEFSLIAVDGDITLEAVIEYKLERLEAMWVDLIKLDTTTGKLSIGDIDRDIPYFDQQSGIIFEVIAYERDAPDLWKTDPYKITLIIQDIDDQKPEITLEGGADPNPTLFRICESSSNSIQNLNLLVDDKDLGENARYQVTLENSEFSKAFRIVPDNGYQKLPFLFTIEDSSLLDYENAPWQSFNFEIQSAGVAGDKSDSKQIQFELINWNDELPIFSKPNGYDVSIDETITATMLVAKVEATDRDGPDITYSLPAAMGSILEITPDGEIKTKVDNVFDYERQETLLIYVTATDKFDGDEEGCNSRTQPNAVTVTVTVNINDINDETPILNAIVNNEIIIEENVVDGTAVDLGTNVIEATDADKDSVLVFEIDWAGSRATKNGKRLTDDLFAEHVTNFLVVTTDTTTVPGKAIPVFTTKEKYPTKPGESPDYEKFDTIVLRLKVTDTDQTLPGVPNFATADISISIKDKNDNAPIFDEKTIGERSVIENADHGISLGRVFAEDADGEGYNNVKYSLKAKAGTQADTVTINEDTGDLSVNKPTSGGENINCDPDIEALIIYVYAKDGEPGHDTEVELTIKIVDVNDVTPILTVMSAITIPEEQAVGTEIPEAGLSAIDLDRDAPNNVVRFSISNAEAAAYFVVNTEKNAGLLTVKSRIDRETLPANPITVHILAMDNDGFAGLSDTEIVTVTITDINDNSPEIQTILLGATENHGPDNPTIGVIEIIDNDEAGHVNSAVTLEIVEVTLGEQILDGFFALSAPSQIRQTTSITLTALKSLKGYSGVIEIALKATDGGLQNEGSVPDEKILKLTVDRYNFAKPSFTFPLAEKYFLRLNAVNFPVLDITGAQLEEIAADDNQGGKYQVDLKVLDPTSTETNEIEHEYFKFLTGNPSLSSSQLYVKKEPEINIDYEVKFRATNRGGEPLLIEDKTVRFMFRDPNEQPVFVTHEITQSIWENDPKGMVDSSGTSGLPLASYGDDTNPLPVVYFLLDPVNMPFKIVTNDDEKYYGIAVDEARFPEGLDREAEDGEMYEVKVVATNGAIPATPDDKSILTVTMNIMNRNDNPPIFTEVMYYGALLDTLNQGNEIRKVKATDLDGPADIISYFITRQVGHGDAENVPEPLRIPDPISGAITLNFRVTTSMQGFIELDLLAEDSLEGVKNQGTSKALIYIVSDLHRVDFRFLNTIEDIDALQTEILAILKKTFEFECIYEKSNIDTEDGETVAVFSVHFINMDDNKPVLKEEIIDKASVITVISSLTGEFNKIGLALKSFVDNYIFPEDLSEYYKTWLIGVAVVMGVLIAFMIIAFTFKYLGMRKQIARLTGRKFASMDSGLNRIAAPNTNTHTHDGSNPVFIQEHKEKIEMPDNVSMSSGDSELYGVENNPVFSNHVEKF